MSNLGLQPRGRKEPNLTERLSAAPQHTNKLVRSLNKFVKMYQAVSFGYVHFFHIWVMLWLRLKSGIKRLCVMRCKES